jgi:hypothetical protein
MSNMVSIKKLMIKVDDPGWRLERETPMWCSASVPTAHPVEEQTDIENTKLMGHVMGVNVGSLPHKRDR